MLILIKHLEQRLTHKYTFSVCYHRYLPSQVAILGRHCLAWTQIEQASHLFLKKNIYSFIHFFWAALGLPCCTRVSLVVVSWGYSVAACGLLIAVASLVAQVLGHMGLVVAAFRLDFPGGHGISVPRPGIEPVSPALTVRFLTTEPPGKSPSQSPCCS